MLCQNIQISQKVLAWWSRLILNGSICGPKAVETFHIKDAEKVSVDVTDASIILTQLV